VLHRVLLLTVVSNSDKTVTTEESLLRTSCDPLGLHIFSERPERVSFFI
jgi:hypothetical protein